MRTLFLEAKSTIDVNIPDNYLKELPDKIGLVTTIQFINSIDRVKKKLESMKKEVFIGKGARCKYRGQILGCDVSAAEHFKQEAEGFLYIGSGEFHPVMIALKTNKKVFKFNPLTNEFSEVKKSEIEKINGRLKGMRAKFYSSQTIGVLVSTKQGQQNLKIAEKLRKNYSDKKFHVFAFDTLDFSQLENFPDVQFWINTACSRIVYDDAIERGIAMINYEDVE